MLKNLKDRITEVREVRVRFEPDQTREVRVRGEASREGKHARELSMSRLKRQEETGEGATRVR